MMTVFQVLLILVALVAALGSLVGDEKEKKSLKGLFCVSGILFLVSEVLKSLI